MATDSTSTQSQEPHEASRTPVESPRKSESSSVRHRKGTAEKYSERDRLNTTIQKLRNDIAERYVPIERYYALKVEHDRSVRELEKVKAAGAKGKRPTTPPVESGGGGEASSGVVVSSEQYDALKRSAEAAVLERDALASKVELLEARLQDVQSTSVSSRRAGGGAAKRLGDSEPGLSDGKEEIKLLQAKLHASEQRVVQLNSQLREAVGSLVAISERHELTRQHKKEGSPSPHPQQDEHTEASETASGGRDDAPGGKRALHASKGSEATRPHSGNARATTEAEQTLEQMKDEVEALRACLREEEAENEVALQQSRKECELLRAQVEFYEARMERGGVEDDAERVARKQHEKPWMSSVAGPPEFSPREAQPPFSEISAFRSPIIQNVYDITKAVAFTPDREAETNKLKRVISELQLRAQEKDEEVAILAQVAEQRELEHQTNLQKGRQETAAAYEAKIRQLSDELGPAKVQLAEYKAALDRLGLSYPFAPEFERAAVVRLKRIEAMQERPGATLHSQGAAARVPRKVPVQRASGDSEPEVPGMSLTFPRNTSAFVVSPRESQRSTPKGINELTPEERARLRVHLVALYQEFSPKDVGKVEKLLSGHAPAGLVLEKFYEKYKVSPAAAEAIKKRAHEEYERSVQSSKTGTKHADPGVPTTTRPKLVPIGRGDRVATH